MIHLAVVGHRARQNQAEALASSLGAELFLDHLTLGATWNHLNALNWGTQHAGHLIVMEDDAQPVSGFTDLASAWVAEHPNDLTSFYLGTGRPPQHQTRIAEALADADHTGASYIALPQLIHAVAYAIPCRTIPTLNLSTKRVADFGLGQAWTKATRRPILYTVPSYVDHADQPSVEQPWLVSTPRKAWRLHVTEATQHQPTRP